MTAGDPQKGLGAHGNVLPLLGRPEVSHEKKMQTQRQNKFWRKVLCNSVTF